MPVEVLILALASAVRPSTSLAAVYALLGLPRARALLAAFVVAGLAFSVALGLLVVIGLGGFEPPGRDARFRAFVDVVAGVASIAYAAGVWSGRATRLTQRERVSRDHAWAERVRRAASLKGAAALGVATHVPGLFYLVALDAIAGGDPAPGEAGTAVLVYNAIWFSLPVAAWFAADRRATEIRLAIDRSHDWARRHEQGLIALVFALVGLFLLTKGAAGLL